MNIYIIRLLMYKKTSLVKIILSDYGLSYGKISNNINN
jgi:hypothetical protein